MKALLETRVLAIEGVEVRVAWRFARSERGILVIDLAYEEGLQRSDFGVVAELIAVHLVLFPDPLAGIQNKRARASFILMVSQPEVVDIVKQRSNLSRALPYAAPFRTLLRDVEIYHASGLLDAPWDEDFPDAGAIEEASLTSSPP